MEHVKLFELWSSSEQVYETPEDFGNHLKSIVEDPSQNKVDKMKAIKRAVLAIGDKMGKSEWVEKIAIVQPLMNSLSPEEGEDVTNLMNRYKSLVGPIRQRKEEEDRKEREEARRKESEEAKKLELRNGLSKFIDLLIAGRISKEEALDTLENSLMSRISTKPSYNPFQYTK
jgi:hypothetical protein